MSRCWFGAVTHPFHKPVQRLQSTTCVGIYAEAAGKAGGVPGPLPCCHCSLGGRRGVRQAADTSRMPAVGAGRARLLGRQGWTPILLWRLAAGAWSRADTGTPGKLPL